MRIKQGSFDETTTAIGRRRGGIVRIGDCRRFAVTAYRLGELAVYRVQGELDRLLANIVSAGAIGRLFNLATFNEEIANKIERPLVGPSLVAWLKSPSLFDLERCHSMLFARRPRKVGNEALQPSYGREDIVPCVPAVAGCREQDAAALVPIGQWIEGDEHRLAGVGMVPLVCWELKSNLEHRQAGCDFHRRAQFSERIFSEFGSRFAGPLAAG